MRKYYKLVLFLMALYSIFYIVFGIYYGWIDDVYMINYLKGTFYQAPDNLLFIDTFLGWSGLLKILYLRIPNIPWFEIIEYFLLALAIIRFNIIVFESTNLKFFSSLRFKYIAVGIINFAFFLHLFQLSTFTSVCVLSSAVFLTSYYSKIRHDEIKKSAFLYFMLFVASFLIRPLLALPIALVIGVAFSAVSRRFVIWSLPLIFLVSFTFYSLQKSDTRIPYLKNIHSRAIYILDGENSPILKNGLMDSDLRYQAFFSWFSGDIPVLYSDSFLKVLEPPNKFSYHRQYFVQHVCSEVNRASIFYSKDYGQYRNWSIRAILIFVIIVLYAINLFSSSADKKRKATIVISLLLFSCIMIIVAGLMKMEERFFYPSALGLLFLLFSLGSDVDTAGSRLNFHLKWMGYTLISVLAFSQVYDGTRAKKELQAEYELKSNIIEEINTDIADKIIFFDSWSMACIHRRPFESWHLSTANKYSVYGETWSNFLPPHMDYLRSFCSDPEDMREYFDCLSGRNDVLFFFTSYRAEMIERYLLDVHHLHVRFIKLNSSDAISELNHSFMPYPYEFGLYKTEKVN